MNTYVFYEDGTNATLWQCEAKSFNEAFNLAYDNFGHQTEDWLCKLTNYDKAKIKMDAAIWTHGRRKGLLTTIINKIGETELKEHPDILKALAVLKSERERLNKMEIF